MFRVLLVELYGNIYRLAKTTATVFFYPAADAPKKAREIEV